MGNYNPKKFVGMTGVSGTLQRWDGDIGSLLTSKFCHN